MSTLKTFDFEIGPAKVELKLVGEYLTADEAYENFMARVNSGETMVNSDYREVNTALHEQYQVLMGQNAVLKMLYGETMLSGKNKDARPVRKNKRDLDEIFMKVLDVNKPSYKVKAAQFSRRNDEYSFEDAVAIAESELFKAWQNWDPAIAQFNTLSNTYVANEYGVEVNYKNRNKRVGQMNNRSLDRKLEFGFNPSTGKESRSDYITEKDDDLNLLNNVFPLLDERERIVIGYRFGLNGNEETTLKDIGKIIGVTRERVRQIETKALEKLAELMST